MKKKEGRIVLSASIKKEQHDTLRYLAYKERRSIADITQEALDDYIEQKSKEVKNESKA